MDLLKGPTEEQMQVIIADLNEDEERFTHSINLLKKWISYQDQLPKNYDERILRTFLRGCKHDLERAKRKIEIYFNVKRTVPELYADRDLMCPLAVQTREIFSIVPLPNLTKDGCRVQVHKLSNNDPALFDMTHILRLFVIMGDIRICEETPISGDIWIMDGDNFTTSHYVRLVNTLLKKALMVANEAYPQRLKGIHVVNAPPAYERVMNFCKAFMKEKLRERFVVHKTVDTLRDYISEDVLPEEYGGKAGSLVTLFDNWKKYIEDKKDWFKEQESVIATGPVPSHLSRSCALDVDGIQGSFRQLTID